MLRTPNWTSKAPSSHSVLASGTSTRSVPNDYWPNLLQHYDSIILDRSRRSTLAAARSTWSAHWPDSGCWMPWPAPSSAGWHSSKHVAPPWADGHGAWDLQLSSESCDWGSSGIFGFDLLISFGLCSWPPGSILCLLSWSIEGRLVVPDLASSIDLLSSWGCRPHLLLASFSVHFVLFDFLTLWSSPACVSAATRFFAPASWFHHSHLTVCCSPWPFFLRWRLSK